MGGYFSKMINFFGAKEDYRLLMVGLDAAGKTSILFYLKLDSFVPTVPTIGFNVEIVEMQDVRFTVWDVGGQRLIRDFWHHYFNGSRGIIFVVDASNPARFCEAALELHSLLDQYELRDAILLIFANKQDRPYVVSKEELVYQLGLNDVRQRWYIQETCAKTGQGIKEGLLVMRKMLLARKKEKTN